MNKDRKYLIVTILEENIKKEEEDILKIIANNLGSNKRSIQEEFRFMQQGETISSYLRERRLTLIYEYKNIEQCSWADAIESLKCENNDEPFWSDVRSYNQSFKATYGVTPTQYMNGSGDISLRKSMLLELEDNIDRINVLRFNEEEEKKQEWYLSFQKMYNLNAREVRIAEALYKAGREMHAVCSVIRFRSSNEKIKQYMSSESIELDVFDLMLYFNETAEEARKVVNLLKSKYDDLFELSRPYVEFVRGAYKRGIQVIDEISEEKYFELRRKIYSDNYEDVDEYFYDYLLSLMLEFTDEERQRIINYDLTRFDKFVAFVIGHSAENRKDSERIAKYLMIGSHKEPEMIDEQYLEFVVDDVSWDWDLFDSLDYITEEEYVQIKEYIFKNYMSDESFCNNVIRTLFEKKIELNEAIDAQIEQQICKKIVFRQKSYAKALSGDDLVKYNKVCEILRSYFHDKIPSAYSIDKLTKKVIVDKKMFWKYCLYGKENKMDKLAYQDDINIKKILSDHRSWNYDFDWDDVEISIRKTMLTQDTNKYQYLNDYDELMMFLMLEKNMDYKQSFEFVNLLSCNGNFRANEYHAYLKQYMNCNLFKLGEEFRLLSYEDYIKINNIKDVYKFSPKYWTSCVGKVLYSYYNRFNGKVDLDTVAEIIFEEEAQNQLVEKHKLFSEELANERMDANHIYNLIRKHFPNKVPSSWNPYYESAYPIDILKSNWRYDILEEYDELLLLVASYCYANFDEAKECVDNMLLEEGVTALEIDDKYISISQDCFEEFISEEIEPQIVPYNTFKYVDTELKLEFPDGVDNYLYVYAICGHALNKCGSLEESIEYAKQKAYEFKKKYAF